MIPEHVLGFFIRSQQRVEKIYRPSWLKSDPFDSIWEVVFDSEPSPTSKANRHLRGEFVKLDWSVPLTDGMLTDRAYETLLVHMRQLVLAFVDLGISPSRTTFQVAHFFKALLLLGAQCDTLSPEHTKQGGLSYADGDTMLELLGNYQSFGVEGIWDSRAKWDAWVEKEVRKETPAGLERWVASCSDAQKRLLEAERSPVMSLDPESIPAIPSTLSPALVARARVLLMKRGAYNEEGFIKLSFVAQALQVATTRIVHSAPVVYHLRQYELATDYRLTEFRRFGVRSELIAGNPTLAERATHEDGYLTATIANGLILVSRAASLVESLANSPLAHTAAIEEALESFPHMAADRTLTVPLRSGLALIRCAMDWEYTFERPLSHLVEQIAVGLPDANGALTAHLGDKAKALMAVPRDSPLNRFLLSEFWGHAHRSKVATWSGSARLPGAGKDWHTSLALCDLLELFTATAFVITTLFGCCRKNEVLELVDSDLFMRNGHWYLMTTLRKHGVDGVRRRMAKPVPKIVARCLHALQSLRDNLLRLTRNRLPAGDRRIFFRLTRSAVVGLQSAELYAMLDMLSEFHGLKLQGKTLWHVRPHQLRRFFAVTFFHFGGNENALPALSWFMGHEGDVERTWRYIKEALNGDEISAAEASLAALAIYSGQESRGADALRELLMQHFKVESLVVMEEDELEGYLAYLHSKGKFTAKPVSIRSAQGTRFDILISIRGVADAPTESR